MGVARATPGAESNIREERMRKIAAFVAVGCSEKTEATKEEEQAFRNMGNIKEPPPEAIKGMQEGLQKAAEQQQQAQQGGN